LQQRPSLFNHFLGAAEQREWESDARAARQRADLLAFLKEATQPGASVAQQGGPMGGGGMGGMMDGGQVPNLKNLDPADRVQEITYCKDSHTVTTANGQTRKFWERNQAPLVVRRSLSH
jgi:hypothetical protein